MTLAKDSALVLEIPKEIDVTVMATPRVKALHPFNANRFRPVPNRKARRAARKASK